MLDWNNNSQRGNEWDGWGFLREENLKASTRGGSKEKMFKNTHYTDTCISFVNFLLCL